MRAAAGVLAGVAATLLAEVAAYVWAVRRFGWRVLGVGGGMDYARIDALVRRNVRHLGCADAAVDTEDLCQTAWERGLARLPSIPTDTERVKYLTRLAKNAAIDRWRWMRHRRTCPLDEGLVGAGNPLAGGDLAGEVATALLAAAAAAAAPPALVLYGLGYSFREAAATTGQGESRAKIQALRWRRRHADMEA